MNTRDIGSAPWFFVNDHPGLQVLLTARKGEPRMPWGVHEWVDVAHQQGADKAGTRVTGRIKTWMMLGEDTRREWLLPFHVFVNDRTHLISEFRFDQTQFTRDTSPISTDPPPRIDHVHRRFRLRRIRINEKIADQRFVFMPGPNDEKVSRFAPEAEWQRGLIGNPAPAFAAPDLEGRQLRLGDYRGRIVLLDFWATWCGPCVVAMPHLQRIADEYGSKGVVVIGVNQDAPGSVKQVSEFLAEKNITFPQVLDPQAALSKSYRVSGIPMTVLIDRQGVARAMHVGFVDGQEQELVEQIEALLEGKPLVQLSRPTRDRAERTTPRRPSRKERTAPFAELAEAYALGQDKVLKYFEPPLPPQRSALMRADPARVKPEHYSGFIFLWEDGTLKGAMKTSLVSVKQ